MTAICSASIFLRSMITLLRDIGLTPEQVRRECAKPFWR